VRIIMFPTLLGLFVLLLLSQVQIVKLHAQVTRGQGEEIVVTADKLEVEEAGKIIRAEGNVEVKRGEMTLKASKMKVNRETQDVEAEGNVSIDAPEWKLKAEGFQLNLPKETAVIRDGEIYIESSHLSLTGRRFEKFTGQAYHIDDGSFTTCICESGIPAWKITAKEIELTPKGEGIIRGGKFFSGESRSRKRYWRPMILRSPAPRRAPWPWFDRIHLRFGTGNTGFPAGLHPTNQRGS